MKMAYNPDFCKNVFFYFKIIIRKRFLKTSMNEFKVCDTKMITIIWTTIFQ